MPRVLIVVADPEKHHRAELAINGPAVAQLQARARAMGQPEPKGIEPRPAGTPVSESLHGTACPMGRPNCRNCGDPAFKASCREAGHCPQCGIAHGVAPDAVLKAKGLILQEV